MRRTDAASNLMELQTDPSLLEVLEEGLPTCRRSRHDTGNLLWAALPSQRPSALVVDRAPDHDRSGLNLETTKLQPARGSRQGGPSRTPRAG